MAATDDDAINVDFTYLRFEDAIKVRKQIDLSPWIYSFGLDGTSIIIGMGAKFHDHWVEAKESKIGTTKRGNGPAYRDKFARTGVRAEDVPALRPYLMDLYEELHERTTNPIILFEGAQGFGLDPDWGDYPYVTSSHCTVGSAILNGVPANCIRNVWGVAKIYETYVGAKKFEGREQIFNEIRDLGEEYGATTGRPRQINWLDFDLLKMALRINGVNKLVINKMDILQQLDIWCLYDGPNLYEFRSREDIEMWLESKIESEIMQEVEIMFSGDKTQI